MSGKIYFILGSSRSGSSIFEFLFSKHFQITALGELRWLFKRGVLDNEKCGCGNKFSNCKFWSAYLESFQIKNPKSIDDLRNFFDMPWNLLPLKFKFLRTKKWKHKWEIYSSTISKTYDFLIKENELIVDNSKSPFYLYVLKKSLKHKINIIYFKRDIRGVVYSYNKTKKRLESNSNLKYMRKKSFLHASFYWIIMDLTCYFMFLKNNVSNTYIVKYENFCSNPLFYFKKFQVKKSFLNYHAVSGNPDRLKFSLNGIRFEKPHKYNWFSNLWLSLLSFISLTNK